MHRWFVLLLIALLPLRGWVGDAMAGEMLAQHAALAVTMDTQVQAHDCMESHAAPGHHQPGTTLHEPASAQHGQDDCPTCAACQVCSSVALSVDAYVMAAHATPNALPTSGAIRFASAEPSRAVEPPIS